MFGKRAAFWGAVAGVSVLTPFMLQVVAAQIPGSSFARFVGFIHRGGDS